jgi:NTE family protein
VYDNLGTTCLEPGRSPDHTYNVFPVEYIVACDAGRGIWATDPIPYFWVSRMRRSFESVFRKAQDAGRARLHEFAATGKLAGFVMPYLGNRDDVLPVRLPDLVTRADVIDYPTDLAAMSADDLERLALHGEQLTRMFIDRWCQEL